MISLSFFFVASVPGMVVDFDIEGVDSTTILASWREPTDPNGIITLYQIEYRVRQSTSTLTVLDISPEDLTTNGGGAIFKRNITDLMPFTDYEARMTAHTRIGPGPPTEFFYTRTDPTGASAPTLIGFALNSSAIQIEWTYPAMPRGIISGYIVMTNASLESIPMDSLITVLTYNATPIELNVTLAQPDDSTNQTLVFTLLLPFTSYSFIVRAYSLQIDSASSDLQIHRGDFSQTVVVKTDQDGEHYMFAWG